LVKLLEDNNSLLTASSESRSASEQQEPTDITIVSTNIDEPEPSTAASSTVQEEN
jgi:hypothetical protein